MRRLVIRLWQLIPHKHKANHAFDALDSNRMEVCRCYAYRTDVKYYGQHAYWKPWKQAI